MVKMVCDCGYKVEDKDHYMVEGKMWHHAIKDHVDMLKSRSAEELAQWIRKADATMGVKG